MWGMGSGGSCVICLNQCIDIAAILLYNITNQLVFEKEEFMTKQEIKSTQTKQAILKAAEEEFSEKGIFLSLPQKIKAIPAGMAFQLVEKVRFLFCASCDSTHKIEFAQQIHKNRGRVPRFLYKGRKNVSGGRGFSSAFDRKRGFDREAARKTIVFRQPQRR